MLLATGTRLGPYEITDPIGAGGMGEVYKARDTRLNRTVAIKVLPEDFSGDADRRQRFEREARVVASLSHPHICALHDVGAVPSTDAGAPTRSYLVMEYLEGETLADRLARGPLPLTQVAGYGAAIAHALDAAHRQHIIHRDLKPANVMLTRSGIKLLDFGLARTAEAALHGSTDLSTQALTNVTMPGAVMGTVPYMSPEQLEGRVADARSDIFALGAVLYEMATGRRAFAGTSAAAISSTILTSEPPPVASSPALDQVIRTCLEKDADRRWQSAHDVALQLESLNRRDDAASVRSRPTAYLPWAVAAAAVVLAVIALMWGVRRGAGGLATNQAVAPAAIAFPMLPPAGGAFNQFVEWISAAVAPHSRAIAYSASGEDGVIKIWLRSLDSAQARPIEGTEGGMSPFWSPDGRALAFFANGKLKRLDVGANRAPVTICTVQEAIGQMGTWGAGDKILFASVQGEALLSVDASGGTPVEVRKPDPARSEARITWPTFLPDGRSYLFLSASPDDSGVVMLSDASGNARKLLDVKSNAQYVDPGYVLFASDGALVARRFDPVTSRLSGDVIPVADRVAYFRSTGLAQFSASATGLVAYQGNQDVSRGAVFDKTGREKATLLPRGSYNNSLSLSPDGRRLLFSRIDPRVQTLDIWMLDVQRGVEERITQTAHTESYPLWGPSGTLIYAVASGSPPRLVTRELATGKEQELTPRGARLQIPTSVSPDGRFVLYSQRTPRGTFDVMVRRLVDNQTLTFRETAANETQAQFSPDGSLVAYVSNESGRPEVIVAPFPTGLGVTASNQGGNSPRWSSDGRELFFIADDGSLMAATVRRASAPEIGRPWRLFSTRGADGFWGSFEVAGQDFYAIVQIQVGSQQPMTVIANWPASLSR